MQYYVYILANATNVALYIGVTSNLSGRVYQHRNCLDPDSFTAKYKIHKLVYFEETTDVKSALEREKQLKKWRRSKKNWLIEQTNPCWNDLYPGILE
jgi:putative endonuclease